MNYTMTKPCKECPFLIGSGFRPQALREHASGSFGCHKACDVDESEQLGISQFVPNAKTPHCAGALIALEKAGKPHQMMRIAERLGMYDPTKLDMSAPVQSLGRVR